MQTRATRLKSVVALLSLFNCCNLATVAAADLETVRTFDIAPQRLETALIEFSKQADLQVIGATDTLSDTQTKGVRGKLTSREALSTLLENTSIAFNSIGTHSVQIVPLRAKTSARHASNDELLHLVQAENAADAQTSPVPAAASGVADKTAEDKKQVQEIIVTAQRREERLVDAPLSVAVIGGQQLDTSNGQGITEALSRVPGVSNAANGGNNRTGSSTGAIVIRGVSPFVGAGATAYYLDSVPFGFVNNPQAPDANAYDLERVEVLRGPQGTLYGASALNGVVRVLTHEPNLDRFEFKARTSISGTERGSENYRADAAMNVPIVEGKLAVRAVVGLQDLGGWLDNVNEKDANDTQVNNYRLRIAAKPTDRLSLGFLAWMSRTDNDAPHNSPNGETRPTSLDERSALDFDLFGFKAGYDFAGFAFTSSTSSIDFDQTARFDYRPFTGADRFQNYVQTSEVFAQEVALSSTGEGNWRWSIGAIYRDAEDYQRFLRTDVPSGAFSPGYLAPTVDGRSSESFAVFGELTRVLFDGRVELTAGLRQFHDETEYTEISNRTVVGGVTPVGGLVHSTGEFDHLTPRLVASWHPAPDSTLYASYGEGFRSGLSQTAQAGALGYPAVDPDELINYEIGYKAIAWGGRLNFETALFYIDWQNVQTSEGVVLSSSPLIIGSALINKGSANGFGFEAGASTEVIDGLTLSGSFSWNGLETENTGRLAGSPEYTVATSVDYAFPLGGDFDGRLSVSANYVPEQIAAGTGNTPAEEALTARASFTLDAPDHWSLSLFVENLTDEDAVVYDPFAAFIIPPSPPNVWDIHQPPRTIGVQLQYRY